MSLLPPPGQSQHFHGVCVQFLGVCVRVYSSMVCVRERREGERELCETRERKKKGGREELAPTFGVRALSICDGDGGGDDDAADSM